MKEDLRTTTVRTGKGLRKQQGTGRKEISGGSTQNVWREIVQGWFLTDPLTAGSPEPPEFGMGSTIFSQESYFRPDEQEGHLAWDAPRLTVICKARSLPERFEKLGAAASH